MDKTVKIWQDKDKKGNVIYCVTVCGKYEEFKTQLEAANYADAMLSICGKKKNGDNNNE